MRKVKVKRFEVVENKNKTFSIEVSYTEKVLKLIDLNKKSKVYNVGGFDIMSFKTRLDANQHIDDITTSKVPLIISKFTIQKYKIKNIS